MVVPIGLLSALAVMLKASRFIYFINFASPLAECPCSTGRASSNRWMLPNLNYGTDHLVIRFDGHGERIAFYFIAAWRRSKTF